jgi:hypothetical protein
MAATEQQEQKTAGRNGAGMLPYSVIVAAEHQAVVAAFEKLKQRKSGELRVATRLNPGSKLSEIVYLGVHEKEDLDPLHRLYKQAERGGVSF